MMELGRPGSGKGVVETGIGIAIMSRATVAKDLRLARWCDPARAAPDPRAVAGQSARKIPFSLLSTFAEFATRKMREMASHQ